MRSLRKLQEPQVLASNCASWLDEFVADQGSNTKKYRYRHPDIKQTLKKETGYKCVYCESKIGHNTPGDIEHKVPTSKNISLHFTWNNLTIACTECNRRKNNYYEQGQEFLDPYVDDVENILEHHGPLVLWQSNNVRAEISVKTLGLHTHSRKELIINKICAIDDFNNLIERYLSEQDESLKNLLWCQINEKISKDSEYSAMLSSVLKIKDITGG